MLKSAPKNLTWSSTPVAHPAHSPPRVPVEALHSQHQLFTPPYLRQAPFQSHIGVLHQLGPGEQGREGWNGSPFREAKHLATIFLSLQEHSTRRPLPPLPNGRSMTVPLPWPLPVHPVRDIPKESGRLSSKYSIFNWVLDSISRRALLKDKSW